MGLYKCMRCGKVIELDLRVEKVRCPYCGYRILRKLRPPTVKVVKAR